MALNAYRHRSASVKKARYRARDFEVRVRVLREPVYAGQGIYGRKMKAEKAGAYVATACIGGGRSLGKTCASARGRGPTAAARKAVRALTAKWR